MTNRLFHINLARIVLSLLLVLVSGILTAKPAYAARDSFQVIATTANVCSGKPCYLYQVKVNGSPSKSYSKPVSSIQAPNVWVKANSQVTIAFNINGFGWKTCKIAVPFPSNVNVPLWLTIRYIGNGKCKVG